MLGHYTLNIIFYTWFVQYYFFPTQTPYWISSSKYFILLLCTALISPCVKLQKKKGSDFWEHTLYLSSNVNPPKSCHTENFSRSLVHYTWVFSSWILTQNFGSLNWKTLSMSWCCNWCWNWTIFSWVPGFLLSSWFWFRQTPPLLDPPVR